MAFVPVPVSSTFSHFLNQRVPAMAPKSKSQFKGRCCRVWIIMHPKRGNHDWEWSCCSWYLVSMRGGWRGRNLPESLSLGNGFWTLAPRLVQTPHGLPSKMCPCANVASGRGIQKWQCIPFLDEETHRNPWVYCGIGEFTLKGVFGHLRVYHWFW